MFWCTPPSQRQPLMSTTKEVCVCAPCTGWCMCVGPRQAPFAEGSLYSWASQYGSRHPVEAGAEAQGINASPRGGEADLECVWPGTGEPIRCSGDSAKSPLVLSNSSSSTGAGYHVTDVAKARLYGFPPIASVPGWGQCTSGITVLAGPSLVLGHGFLGYQWEILVRRDLLSQAGGTIFHPRPELWK